MTTELAETQVIAKGPPRRGLVSTGLWLLVVAVVLLAGLTPLSTGTLAGSDDYMRFVRVFAWLDGTGWYDQTIARLNAPYGAVVPWSRLVDLPLAGLVVALAPFLGRAEAAMIAATLVPSLLLLALLKAAHAMCRPVTGRRAAVLGAVIVVLLPNLITAMMPGRVDHHTWQLVLMALALSAFAWMVANPSRWQAAAVAGVVFGVSLWVGGETVPWLAVANAALALIWILDGPRIARAGAHFALGMGATCLLVLPLARTPGLWAVPECDTYSLPSLGLAYAVFGFWATATVFRDETRTRLRRLTLGIGATVVIGGAWVTAFPSCALGPYGEIDPRLVDTWLATIGEAQSLPSYALARPGTAVAMTLSPLIGCIGALIALSRATTVRQRRLWIVYGAFVCAGLALAVWQIRVLPFANLFAVAPLAWVVTTAWRAIDRQTMRFGRKLTKAAVLLAIGPLGTAFGAFDTFRDRQASSSTEDAGRTWNGACNLASAIDNDVLIDDTGIIAAPVDVGAELLFRTPHGVVGAPYHRNAAGILDSQAIFGATEDAVAERIIDERGAQAVIICPGVAEMQLYQGGKGTDTFAERLRDGDHPPWLVPIDVPRETGALIFRVD